MNGKRKVIESYLRRLRLALGTLPVEERQEICRELESHLDERAGESDTALQSCLAELGEPETYARAFHDDYELSVALASGSTARLFAQSLRLAGRSIWAAAGFLFFLSLFAISGGLMAVAMIKPFFPQQVGLWLPTSGGFIFGFVDTTSIAGVQEIMGWWFIPVALVSGFVLWILASRLLEKFVASLRKPRDDG